MDYSTIPLFTIMKSKLDYLSERQAVLAQNVANADTPGYQAKDVAAPDFKAMAQAAGGGAKGKLPMTITSSRDIQPISAAGASAVEKRHTTDELNPNGNNVVIEEELSKVATNQAEYQKVLNLYAKAISMFKTAIGNTSGG